MQTDQVMSLAIELSRKYLIEAEGSDTPTVILAAELSLAMRAAAGRMPLQELMDNLLANVPVMYKQALFALTQDNETVQVKENKG